MVWLTIGEVLAAWTTFSPNVAVMECGPAASEEVVRVAVPDPLRVPVPSDVAPSKKVTLPAGTPLPLVTVAVKTTEAPGFAGLALDASAVVVACAGSAVISTESMEKARLSVARFCCAACQESTAKIGGGAESRAEDGAGLGAVSDGHVVGAVDFAPEERSIAGKQVSQLE